MSQRATVIGGYGFIGRHLARHLREAGHEVWIAPRGHEQWLDGPLGTVYYCAGLTADYAVRPHDTVEAHVALLNRVLRRGRFDALVYLSSTRLYDSLPLVAADEQAPLALDPREPRHLYDLSKAMGEALCRGVGGGRARVARLSCVYRDTDDADGFLPQLLRGVAQAMPRAEPGQPPRLQMDTSPHLARDYVHLDDVLQALAAIAERGTQPVYNVASGRNTSNRELFARLRELTGVEIIARRHDLARPAPRIHVARLRDEFGWQPVQVTDKLAELLPALATC